MTVKMSLSIHFMKSNYILMFSLYHLIVSSIPSSKLISGFHFKNSWTREISARLSFGSKTGGKYSGFMLLSIFFIRVLTTKLTEKFLPLPMLQTLPKLSLF